jgi:hypothetical protein
MKDILYMVAFLGALAVAIDGFWVVAIVVLLGVAVKGSTV